MKRQTLTLIATLPILFGPVACAFMTYHGPGGGMPVSGDWPQALKKLVQTDSRVLGVVGPIIDTRIYCAGNTTELNLFLDHYATVPDTRLKVVLHPGHKTIGYPTLVFGPDGNKIGEKVHILDVDWGLHIGEFPEFRSDAAEFKGNKFITTLDIWLGGQIKFKKLNIPPTLHLQSSGELEKFIDNHEKKRKQINNK